MLSKEWKKTVYGFLTLIQFNMKELSQIEISRMGLLQRKIDAKRKQLGVVINPNPLYLIKR